MSSNSKANRKPVRAFALAAFSIIIVFATFSVAFGDFVPITSSKVLGVGRIQSAPATEPVASENKFTVASTESTAIQVSELSEPIAREVAVVEAPPAPEPAPEPPSAPAPVVNNSDSVTPDDSWITTLATNYATPNDGFLNKKTASGAYTSTTSMGVAHKNLPLGTQIELYCPRTGLSCVATVNDRGPYDGRPDTFDFQMAVTSALGNNTGWYTVQYRVIG